MKMMRFLEILGVQGQVSQLFATLICFSDLQFEGRKTEEGFLIYKEAELKIDPEAGGTPLCPFDCECCKFIGF